MKTKIILGIIAVVANLWAFLYDGEYKLASLRVMGIAVTIYLMYQGNRQGKIPQESNEAGIMKPYSKRVYKKSQRISGRIQFGVGVFGLLMFLLSPEKYLMYAFLILCCAMYVGAFMTLYKGVKAIDE